MPQVLTSCSLLRMPQARSIGYRLKPQFVLNVRPVCHSSWREKARPWVVSVVSTILSMPTLKSSSLIECKFFSTLVSRKISRRLFHILIDPESPFDGEATKELRRVTTAERLTLL